MEKRSYYTALARITGNKTEFVLKTLPKVSKILSTGWNMINRVKREWGGGCNTLRWVYKNLRWPPQKSWGWGWPTSQILRWPPQKSWGWGWPTSQILRWPPQKSWGWGGHLNLNLRPTSDPPPTHLLILLFLIKIFYRLPQKVNVKSFYSKIPKIFRKCQPDYQCLTKGW